MTARPSDDSRLAWLRLARSEGVGPRTFAGLIQRYRTPQAALDALPGLARAGGRRSIRICPADDASREIDRAQAIGARLLIASDPDFPSLLGEIDPPPPVIHVLGDPAILKRPSIGIVGARNASAGGRKLAQDIAAGLGAAGILVISGLARGIDTAAHAGSIDTGTAAVLAGGVDNIYPPENKALHARIAEQGAIISEMPPGFSPVAAHFPRRNRIISGLSRGIVVVEAAIGSGSLITARHALEQNRDVFAVPGSPLDPRSRGANDLLRQGAILTETAADVIAALDTLALPPRPQPTVLREPAQAPDTDMSAARADVVSLLGPTPVEIDELIRRSGHDPDTILTILLELELGGRLHRSAGQRVALI